MNVDADAVQSLIAENARVAQDQDEYSVRTISFLETNEVTKIMERCTLEKDGFTGIWFGGTKPPDREMHKTDIQLNVWA